MKARGHDEPIFVPVPFRRHRLLLSGHLQTLAGIYLPGRRYAYQARQHSVAVSDGDRVVLHLDEPSTASPATRWVLLVPGLCGCHRSPYVQRLAARLNAGGYRTARIDMRGFGASAGTARQPAHAGRSDDLARAIEALGRLTPSAPVTAIGFSLGGNQVLKLVGESDRAALYGLDSAVAVAAPIDLMACTRNIRRGINRCYDRHFVRLLWRQAQSRAGWYPELRDRARGRRPRTLFEFDDRITAPLSGFRNAVDYYRRTSAGRWLSQIQLPTWVITADDDPLVPVACYQEATPSRLVQVTVTRGGGHLGFVGGAAGDPDRRWLDWRILDWLASRLPAHRGASSGGPAAAGPRRQPSAES